MDEERYLVLLERIRRYYDLDEDNTPELALEFPPATEEQIRETEQVLKFSLPPLLRFLYLHLANGGFGPGYGIIGAIGGYPLDDGMGDDIAHGYLTNSRRNKLVQLDELEMTSKVQWHHTLKMLPAEQTVDWENKPVKLDDYPLGPHDGEVYLYELPEDTWPDRLLPLCYWGCGIASCMDATTDHIYQVFASIRGRHYIVEYRAASLEEWLERWLAGEDLQ